MKRREIENPGDTGAYVAGLRRRKRQSHTVTDDTILRSRRGQSQPSTTLKDGVHVDGRLVGLVIGLALAVCGCAVGFPLGAIKGSTVYYRDPKVQPAPVITETQVVHKLPAACERALKGFELYLDSAAAITSANNKQLDIFSESYQAILSKDWKRLNDLADRQRQLEATVNNPTTRVAPHVIQLKKDFTKCRQDLS